MRRAASTLFALACACGPGEAERSFELEIRGFSARASTLVLKVRAAERPLLCKDVTLDNAVSVEADEEQRWERSSAAARAFELPALASEGAVVIAVALDPAGAPIQLACSSVTYEGLGNLVGGRIVLTLSRRQ